MTKNQLEYNAQLETRRSNQAREQEQHRSNVANETETHRANVARESENLRHNLITEANQKYDTDMKFISSKYAADSAAAATRYSANRNYSASIYASNLARQTAKDQMFTNLDIAKKNRTSNQAIASYKEQQATMRTWMQTQVSKYAADKSYDAKLAQTSGSLISNVIGGIAKYATAK